MRSAGPIIAVWFIISPFVAVAVLSVTPLGITLGFLLTPYAGLALCALLWWLLRRTATTARRDSLVVADVYETAYLAGGEKRAVDTAIAGLVHRGVLALDVCDRRLQIGEKELVNPHPLEHAVYSVIDPDAGENVDTTRFRVQPVFDQIRARLVESGLIMSERRMQILRFVCCLFVLGSILIADIYLYGVVKYFRQCGIDEWLATTSVLTRVIAQFVLPIAYVYGLCLIVLVPLGAAFELVKSDRSRTGDQVLQMMKEQSGAKELTLGWDANEADTADLVMAMALFAEDVPMHGPLAEIWNAIDFPASSDADGNDVDGGCAGDGCDAFGD